MDMSLKLGIGVLFISITVGLFIFVFTQEKLVDPKVFMSKLQLSRTIYLISDIRQTDDPYRHNVQQCMVDFAGSSGLAGKDINIFSYDGDKCFSSSGTRDISACEGEARNGPTIYLVKGNGSTQFYQTRMVVSIGQEYVPYTCKVNSVR